LPTVSGSQALVALLKQEGVKFVFGNPGTTELPLLDQLVVDNDVRYLLGLQEAAVVAMADGYAQASRSLAVVNLHLSPGLGNAMGMLYNAQKAASPLLLTAGQQDQSFSATEPILWGDMPVLARPFVKWSSEVHRLEDLPRLIHRAAKTALAPPTGPVFLSLPADILRAEGDLDLQVPTRVAPRLRGDHAAIEEAAALLAAAKRPLIIAGDAVAQSRAHVELVDLAETLGAPVYSELLPSTASFPTSHPLFRGAMVPRAQAVRQVLEQHDVLLSVGADLFTLPLPSDIEPIPPCVSLIHLDVDPWELGKNYATSVAILGDPKGTLPDLTAAVRERMTNVTRDAARDRLKTIGDAIRRDRESLVSKARMLATESTIEPLALLQAIGEILPKDAIVVEETTSSGHGIRQLIRSDDPQSFFGLRGGATGWALPAAVGVKLALPDRPVVALIGDGGAMYTCQALWTAAHDRIAVTFVILNNKSYRILKQRLYMAQGNSARMDRYLGLELDDPAIDFVGLARALGMAAERASTIADATNLIEQGIRGNSPMLVDVGLNREFRSI
jgi:benzoylformate decarboxylase